MSEGLGVGRRFAFSISGNAPLATPVRAELPVAAGRAPLHVGAI
jgi:hypothetical protein